MMVTETETFTSTLHHNIFTYLDYIFSLQPTYLIYMYKEDFLLTNLQWYAIKPNKIKSYIINIYV